MIFMTRKRLEQLIASEVRSALTPQMLWRDAEYRKQAFTVQRLDNENLKQEQRIYALEQLKDRQEGYITAQQRTLDALLKYFKLEVIEKRAERIVRKVQP